MNRYLSITFDDGLFGGAAKATTLLNRYDLRSCFYVVTGWVRPIRLTIRDPFNAGRDHGSWDDWREIQRMGHEVGSHTQSHFNATGRRARWLPGRLRRELRGSFEKLRQELAPGPLSIAMPWNAATPSSELLVKRFYRTCRLGTSQPSTNDLRHVHWWRLASWAPNSDVPVGNICRTIEELAEGHWLILQFHSLDDEGYMPISSGAFNELLAFISQQSDVRVTTPAEMAASFGDAAHPSWSAQRVSLECPRPAL
jgi:peptidoglycan/xylan/chitin deacetylase (PgdA/CDA1 family)